MGRMAQCPFRRAERFDYPLPAPSVRVEHIEYGRLQASGGNHTLGTRVRGIENYRDGVMGWTPHHPNFRHDATAV